MLIFAKLVQSADNVDKNAAAAEHMTLKTHPDLIP